MEYEFGKKCWVNNIEHVFYGKRCVMVGMSYNPPKVRTAVENEVYNEYLYLLSELSETPPIKKKKITVWIGVGIEKGKGVFYTTNAYTDKERAERAYPNYSAYPTEIEVPEGE